MRLFACAYVRAGKKLIYTIYPRLKLYKLLYIKYLVLRLDKNYLYRQIVQIN